MNSWCLFGELMAKVAVAAVDEVRGVEEGPAGTLVFTEGMSPKEGLGGEKGVDVIGKGDIPVGVCPRFIMVWLCCKEGTGGTPNNCMPVV
jgi:hypothetical protein